MTFKISRRQLLSTSALLLAVATTPVIPVSARSSREEFAQWVARFRRQAKARGISDATYDRVLGHLKPDTSVYARNNYQPEFREKLWQYLNRRVSDWRIGIGKERAREYGDLLRRIERDYGVDDHTMLGLWGMESAFGEVVRNPKHMRPVIPALAALAWGEPRRRTYWEKELLNALVIIQRGWAKPDEMIGSWAGAMGHTQWMPEVWLNMGVDYNKDRRISPFGPPDDALAGTARFIQRRGRYVRGLPWGYEVRVPPGAAAKGKLSIASWADRGVKRADGRSFPRRDATARLWQPDAGGPAFLLTQNFYAVRSYNPASSYALAIVHLGDRIAGKGPFIQQFRGGERALTLPEIQEVQRLLTARGFDTGGTDGRVGRDTMRAVAAFQKSVGLKPADGYAGLAVLGRLRQGG